MRPDSRKNILMTWHKPASPCLSSRFPYGEEITREKLGRVEDAEEVVLSLGIPEVRVRSYGDLARIEVPASYVPQLEDHAAQLYHAMQELGFDAC